MPFSPGHITALTGMVFSFLIFFGIFWLFVRLQHRRAELRADVQTKLIERFGSSQELITFLESPTGQQFVAGVQNEKLTIHDKALGGIRKAVILSFLGLGLIAIFFVSGADWVSWFGILFLSLGVGYVVAAFVAIRLSRETTEAGNVTPQV